MPEIIYPDKLKELAIAEHDGISTPTKKSLVYGWDSVGLQKVRLKVDANGQVYVANPAGEQYTDATVVNAAYKGNLVLGTDGANYQILAVDSSGNLQVDILNATLAVTQSGTWNIGTLTSITNALPAGTNNIGDVDILSIAAGDNNIGNVDLASAIPAGTNAIGKLLPPDIDVTTHTNYIKKYYTSAGAVTDGIIWSPAAGKRWHITDIFIGVSAAATVTLEDDLAAGDDPVWKMELAANSGFSHHFDPMYPLSSAEDAADLLITTSAGNVYCTIVGFEI